MLYDMCTRFLVIWSNKNCLHIWWLWEWKKKNKIIKYTRTWNTSQIFKRIFHAWLFLPIGHWFIQIQNDYLIFNLDQFQWIVQSAIDIYITHMLQTLSLLYFFFCVRTIIPGNASTMKVYGFFFYYFCYLSIKIVSYNYCFMEKKCCLLLLFFISFYNFFSFIHGIHAFFHRVSK